MQTETGLTNRKRTRSDRGFWTGPIGWNGFLGVVPKLDHCHSFHESFSGLQVNSNMIFDYSLISIPATVKPCCPKDRRS